MPKLDVTNRDIYEAIGDFRNEVRSCYVSNDKFEARMNPVEKVVYSLVGVILIAVVTAIIGLVLSRVGVSAK